VNRGMCCWTSKWSTIRSVCSGADNGLVSAVASARCLRAQRLVEGGSSTRDGVRPSPASKQVQSQRQLVGKVCLCADIRAGTGNLASEADGHSKGGGDVS